MRRKCLLSETLNYVAARETVIPHSHWVKNINKKDVVTDTYLTFICASVVIQCVFKIGEFTAKLTVIAEH